MSKEIYFQQAAEIGWQDLGGGVSRQLLGHDDSLMMVKVRFDTGAEGALHHHPHIQVSYVESGAFELRIGAETRLLQAGDGYFVPPDIPHGCVCRQAGVLVDVFTPARQDFLPARETGV
ncbi:cupin domain-containing protein [Niabella terrae]